MVIVAQLVERRSVAAEVTGAEPVYHPVNYYAQESRVKERDYQAS